MTLTSTVPSIRQMVMILRTVTPLNWFAITIPALVPLPNPPIRPPRTPPQVQNWMESNI